MEDIIQLRPATNPFREGDKTARRDGTLLEKGVLLTEDFLIRNEFQKLQLTPMCT